MLILTFLLSTLALILQGVLFPHIALLAFAPFLSLSILRCKMTKALWLSALAGILMDLVSNDPIGIHALNYVLVSAFLFRFKKHFLYDEPFHFSLFSALVSSVSTGLQLMLLFLFDRKVPIDGKWTLLDLIGMPVIDGLFAFVWFAAPLSLLQQLKKMGNLFWLKKKNHFFFGLFFK
jgi:rod shape-determining protein MreD